MSDSSMSADIALAAIKALVCVYDVITYPIYSLVQKPWTRLRTSQAVKARPLDPNSPYSPWIRVCPDRPARKHFIDECETVAELFSRAVRVFGDKQCFGFRPVIGEEDERQPDGKVFRKLVLDDYLWFSYHEIDAKVEAVAKGLLHCGVRPKQNVVIFAETRLEWMVSCQALFRIGATVATLYATLGDDAVVHGINETEVTHIITNFDLLGKLATVADRLPHVRSVVYMDGHREPNLRTLFTEEQRSRIQFHSFARVEELGRTHAHLTGETPRPEDTAVLMYTSGSTGIPKGVMISHKNLLHAIKAFFTIAHALTERDVYCGYLPLAHVLELAAELFFFSLGMSVGYATPLTLTDKSTGIKKGVPGDTTLLRPTVLCAVPLILDRIRKGINEQFEQRGRLMRNVLNFAIEYKKFWTKKGFNTPIVDLIVCRKIRALLGGRVRLLAAGAAPLAPETHEFIRTCLNVELLQGYGLTETSASATLMDLNDLSVGRVGAPLEGVQIKLVDWVEGNYHPQDRPHPRGEIVVGGDNITAGYYKNPDLTRECYKEENGVKWFHTGDIGEIFEDGSVKIIDRKKDLVKLAFGEYISLGKIESELKACPLVDNICVYGDSFHSYLIALVVPNAKALRALALRLSKDQRLAIGELCRDPEVCGQVLKAVVEFAQRSRLLKTEMPAKMKLCAEEWLPDSGLVTAALKLRRKEIQDFYQIDINRLYGIENSKST